MNLLDGLILAAAVAAGVGGYRLGFVARVASWIGMAAGLVISASLLPTVIGTFRGPDPTARLMLAAGLLIGGAFLGQAIGLLAGTRLHLAIPEGSARAVDRSGGMFTGILGVFVAVWILLPTMADLPGWSAEQTRNSAVARMVDALAPPPPDTLQALRRLVGENQFPQVFAGLQPAPEVGPPPADSGLSPDVINRVTAATVKVEGIACRRIQEGSGFAVSPEIVVTNAHVVAGEGDTDVIRPDGSSVSATVVVFDSDRDLAVLQVPGLGHPTLPIGDTGTGGTGAVFGYPGGGPLRVSPFQVEEEVEAVGRDLYDGHDTRRQVLILAADLHPGDSGAALADAGGSVVGVAFAIAPDRPQTAYALTTDELRAVLQNDLTTPANTGPCLNG
jgi:S1-C subfamily serine protease